MATPNTSLVTETKKDMTIWVTGIGTFCLNRIAYLGEFAQFCISTILWLIWRKPRRETLFESFYKIGVLSLPVVMLTGMFIGMVLAVQTYTQFKDLGLETMLGGVICLSLVRELGPVLAATMLAGRVGSSIAAELGTMRVTEQIDALSSMGVSPIYYLAVPRFLACLILIPALTIIADFMGVIGGTAYCVNILGINEHHFWSNAESFVTAFDIFAGLLKSIFFGGAIALISCHQGFTCDPGAEGVGKASTESFVYSFVAILFLDLVLAIFLDQINIYFGISPSILK